MYTSYHFIYKLSQFVQYVKILICMYVRTNTYSHDGIFYGKPYIVVYFRILHAYTIIYSIYIQRVFLFWGLNRHVVQEGCAPAHQEPGALVAQDVHAPALHPDSPRLPGGAKRPVRRGGCGPGRLLGTPAGWLAAASGSHRPK